MHLCRTGVAHQIDDFGRGGAAHDRVINQNNALALKLAGVGVMFQLHAKVADLIGWLDKGTTDIMVTDNAKLKGNAAFFCVSKGRRHTGIGDWHDNIGVNGRLTGQFAANVFAHVINACAFDDAVGAGEIDMFENAETRFLRFERFDRPQAMIGDFNDFTRFDVADEFRANDIKANRFR